MKTQDNDVLQHYASPYYDPVYQHQYYLDHKEDIQYKRRANSKSSVSPGERLTRNATLYAIRQGVRNAQKKDTTEIKTTHKAKIAAAKTELKTTLKKMSNKLTANIKKLNAQTKDLRTSTQEANKKLAEEHESTREASTKAHKDIVIKKNREIDRNIDSLKRQMKATKSTSSKVALQRQINQLQKSKQGIRLENRQTATMASIQAANKYMLAKEKNDAKLKTTAEANSESAKKMREDVATQRKKMREDARDAIKATRDELSDKLNALRKNYSTTLKRELELTRDNWDTTSSGSYASSKVNAYASSKANTYAKQIAEGSARAAKKTAKASAKLMSRR